MSSSAIARRLALDLHQAHAAVRRHREAGVPAVVRDLDALLPRGTDDRVAGLEGDLYAIQLENGHLSSP
jgi:NAD(P)-dependent dehydrogenase (short-subunit alcohol dehydrogenase family)